MIKRLFNKALHALKLIEESEVVHYEYMIGKSLFLIFDIINIEGLIKNKILDFLFVNNYDLVWFRSYYELEENFDFIFNENALFYIILIG